MSMRCIVWLILGALIASLAGCGGGAEPPPSDLPGRIAFVVGRSDDAHSPGDIWIVRADKEGGRIQLTDDPSGYSDPDWSPDGQTIAAASYSATRPLRVIDAEDGSVLAELESQAREPDWSPDGSQLAFVSHRDGDDEIYLVGADGRGLRQLTHNTRFADNAPTWSPDGQRIAFRRTEGTTWSSMTFMTVTAEGRDEQPLADELWAWGVAWSPDGAEIAYLAGDAVYVIDANGSNRHRVADALFGSDVSWSPDERYLVTEYMAMLVGEHWNLRMAAADGTWHADLAFSDKSEMQPDWCPVP